MTVLGWFDLRPVFGQSVTPSIKQISLSASLFNNESRIIPNGTYEVRFGIYSTDRATADAYPSNADAGSRLWEETQTVTVKNGIFRAFLGSVTPLPDTLNFENGDYYIGMRIGTDSEMVPRKKLGSVPRAVNSQFLQGKTIGTKSGDIPVLGNKGKINIKNLPTGTGSKQLVLGNDSRLQDSHQQNTDTGTDTEVFNIGSGTAISGTNFDLTVSSSATPPALRYNGTTQSWQLSNDGSAFTNIPISSTVDFLASADGTGSTSSFSGFELAGTSGDELALLQGCANGQALGWNDSTNVWECTSFSAGLAGTGTTGYATYWSGTSSLGSEAQLATSRGGTGLSGATAANGTLLIGNGSGYTLATITDGAGITVTEGAGSITIASTLGTSVDLTSEITGTLPVANGGTGATALTDLIALTTHTTGNYVATITAGNGISGSSSSEGGTPTIALGALTADWNQTGAFNISLNNVGAGLKILENGATPTLFGIFDVADLSTTDKTYTFPDASGTVLLSGQTLFTAAGTSGSSQAIAFGDTLTIAAGTGITTTGGATDTVTIASTLGTSVDLASEITGTLPVGNGGTGATTFTANGVLYGNTTGAVQVTAAGTSAQLLLANASGVPTFVTLSSDATITNAGVLTIAADAVALGTDTTGNYVASATANGGLTLTGTEGGSLGILLPSATDALSATTSSGSGLELLSTGLTLLQGCATNEVLAWNETQDLWACTSVAGVGGVTGTGTSGYATYWTGTSTIAGEAQLATSRGGTGLSGATAANGTLLIGNGSGYTLATITDGAGITVTEGAGSITIASTLGTSIAAAEVDADALDFTEFKDALTLDAVSTTIAYTATAATDPLLGLSLTANAATDVAETVFKITNALTSSTTDTTVTALLSLDNADTTTLGTTVVTDAISITNSGGSGFTTFLNTPTLDISALGVITGATGITSSGTITFSGLTANSFLYSGTGGALTTTTAPTNGQLLIGSTGAAPVAAALTQGSGITVTNGAGSITIASTLGTSVDLASEITGTLPVGNGGTGATTFTANGVLYGNTTGAVQVTAAGTSAQLLLANASGVPTFVTLSSDATISNAGVLTIAANAVALTTDTTGNYVSSATANGGLTLTGTEGGSLGILLPSATDALSTTTSSGSGLELLSTGLTLLQGCAGSDVLAWNETTDVWACASVAGVGGVTGTGTSGYATYWTGTSTIAGEAQLATSRGGTGVNGATAANGTLLIGNGSGYTLATITDGSGITVTEGAGSITIASTLGTSVDLTSEVTGTLPVGNGGTGATTFTSNGILYGNTTGAVQVTAAGTSAQLLLANASGVPTFVTLSSDATISNAGVLTIAANAVALTTDTTGNYVASATSNGGLTLTGTEGGSLGILLPSATDALSATTSSGSGLELLSTGLTLLQGCATNEVLSWNETTDVWACASVSGVGGVTGTGTNGYVTYWTGTSTVAGEAQLATSRGGTGVNGSAAGNGTLLIGNGSGYTLAALTQGSGITVTNGAGSITITSTLGTSIAAAEVDADALDFSEFKDALTLDAVSTTISYTATAATDPLLGLSLTANAATDVAETVFKIVSALTSSTTDTTVTALLALDNADTTTLGTTVVTDAILITNSGGSGFTNFLNTPTLDISALGVITGATGITSSGTITFSGLTANSFLYSGTGGLLTTTTAPTNGQLLIGSTGVAPVAAALTQGSGITVTNGAGSITIASTLGTSVDLASEITGTLPVGNGGTGATTFTANGVLYGNTTGAVQVTAAGTSAQLLLANASGVPTFVTLSSDATITNAGVLTIAANAVALTTDTTGNYVASATANGGLTLTGTEGGSLGILLPSATDALSATTSSGSGLELLSTGLTLLQGCATNEVLAWNETQDLWACTSVAGVGGVTGTGTSGYATYWTGTSTIAGEAQLATSRGGTGLSGATAANGTLLIGNGSGYTLATITDGAGITVTEGAGTITIASTLGTSIAAAEVDADALDFTEFKDALTLDAVSTTISYTATAATDPLLGLSLTANAATDVAETVFKIVSALTSSTTDTTVTALLALDNADTTTLGTTVVTDAISITNSGGSGFTNFLNTPTLDISAAGVITGATGITSSGTITFSGLTANSFLYSGTGGLLTTTTAPTNGQLLIGSTGAAPVAAGLTQGTGITVTNGAGSITIASTLGTSVDLTSEVTGVLPIANGGTNKALTLAAGAVVWTDADSFEVTSAGTAGQALISGGTTTPTWFAPTAGSILFAGTSGILAQDNASLFFDNTNNYLGIAYNTPAARLDITGNTTTAVAGSEQITALADRDFSGAGNWSGTNWSVGSGVATHTAGANAFTLSAAGLDPDPVAASIYQVTFTTNTTTAGTITPSIGGVSGIAVGQATGANTQTQVITATGTGALTFTPNAAWAGTLDNISVKLITPSNATQIVRNSDNTIGLEIRAGGTGLSNTFVGTNAGKANTTGNSNAFLGTNAGYSNTTGSTNAFLGYNAGRSNTTGYENSFLGPYAGYSNTTGSSNSFLGDQAGYSNTTGSYNLYLGYSTEGSAATASSIGLGYNTTVTASNQLVIGSDDANGSITAAYLGQGVTKASPAGIVLNATGGSGTDNAGAPLTIAGGKGTGNAAGGSIIFQTSDAGASGTTLQSLSTKATLLASGNFGIGDTTPASLFTVGSGDLFQVNSSGAIAAATGITSSGTITFSGLSTAGIVTNTSGGVLSTVASVPIANGGTNATTIGSAGSIPYSTGSAYAFSAVGTTGQALISGGSGVPTFYAPTAGSILFAGTSGILSQDNTNFFWDDTNNYLGLGYATPAARLDIAGNTTTATAGSEQITALADRDFSGAGNWSGTNWSVGSGVATHTAGANAFTLAAAGLDPDPVAGSIYQVTFTTNTTTAGTITVSIGGASGIAVGQATGINTQTQVITATDTSALTFTPDATWAGTLDDISVKLITPSNATQIVRNSDNTIGLEIRAGGTGLNNAFIGTNAGKANTTGSYNSFIGYLAGQSNTTGFRNSFIGTYAGYSNATGSFNSFFGTQTGYTNTTGTQNAFLGYQAGQLNTIGSYNSFIGTYAGSSNTTGNYNSFIGYRASNANTTGSYNSSFGTDAGTSNTTGNYNLYLGYDTEGTVGTESSSIGIGYNTTVTASNQLVIGSANALGSITQAYFGQGVTKASPAGIVLNATGGSGTNNAGAPLTIAAGKGTGNASGGSLIFQTSDAGSTGSTLQSLSTKATLLASGNFGIGDTTPAALFTVGNTDLFQVNSSGIVNGPDGTAVAPTYSFVSNQASGMFTPAIRSLAFSTFGTEAIRIDDTQKVGIGDTTPDGLLDFDQTSTSTTAGTTYGGNFTVSDTGVVTTGTDTTYGTSTSVTRTGATGGTLNTYGNYTTLTNTFASGTGTITGYGDYITATGNTNGTATLYGSYVSATGADTTYGIYATVTGVTAATSYGIASVLTDVTTGANTNYGQYTSVSDTGIVTIDTDTTYGTYTSLTRTGATGGTLNTYGTYVSVVADNAGSGTHNVYGGYFSADRGDTVIGVLAEVRAPSLATSITAVQANIYTDASIPNVYGVRVTSDTGFGSNTNAYGLYLDDVINATNDYGIYQAGSNDDNYFAGNVGIGDTTPDGLLDFDQTSTSTTAATTYGGNFTVSDTGIVTTGTDTTYGTTTSVTRTGATGGTINTYGQYTILTTDNAGAGTSTAYGSYINTSFGIASSADTVYGLYITAPAYSGTTAYGLYVDAGTGAGTEYAAVFRNGNVGIGTTTPAYALDVVAAGTGVIARFNSTNATGCTLADGGTITCTSDERLKKNITGFESGLDMLMSLRPVRYNWKYENDGVEKTFGFIAQEVETVLPKLVITDSNGYKELNTIGLIPVIAQAIKEQQGIIETQKNDISVLALKTDQNITTLAELQSSVDGQLTLAGTELSALRAKDIESDDHFLVSDNRLTSLETLTDQIALDINAQTTQTALLETQMQTLTEQVQTLVDFYATFDLGNLVAKDSLGNVDLLGGTLRAKILETGGLVIENVDIDAPTIGTISVLPPAIDTDNDGNDDLTGQPMTDPEVAERDGTIVRVMTRAMVPMVKGSKIFTSWKGNPGAFSWIEKIKDDNGDYVGFKIRLSAPITEEVKVDWWLVAEK